LIQEAIILFKENPVVKYAKSEDQKKILLQNNELRQELQLSYIKVAYGNQLIRDFSEIISDKDRYINLMVKLLRDEINTFYFLRHYESIQKYITRYYENMNSNCIDCEKYTLKEALELFKDDFGL